MSVKSTFFRQHTILLPRWWVVFVLLLLTVIISYLALKNVAGYLAVTEPIKGRYLVVEGWVDQEGLDQALQVFYGVNSSYEFLITTGGPDKRLAHIGNSTYAEQSAKYLLSKGFAKQQLIVIPTPESAQARTFLSAVMVRDWVLKNKRSRAVSIDVFTAGVHARRTRLLYETAFHSVADIGIYASVSSDFKLSTWWQTSSGTKLVITELLAYIWTVCFFDAGEPGSYQEKWGMRRDI